MSDPVMAQSEPFQVDLKAGQRYAWCACGKSENQPWCDGSHKDTEFLPVVWTAEQDETAFMCGCKLTADQPVCDGSHNYL